MNKVMILLIFLLNVWGSNLWSQWGNTRSDNAQLSTVEGVKTNTQAFPGPDGSWYISYTNLVVNNQVLHLARVDSIGQILWDKVIQEDTPPGSLNAAIVPDGEDGLIIAWSDRRNPNTVFIYANRFDTNGDKMWGDADVRVGQSRIEEGCTKIISDHKNGAIITLFDDDPPMGDFRGIYAYHLRANGQVSWRTYLFPGSFDCEDYDIDIDGEGGLVSITRYLHPLEQENQIRAMRLDSNGVKVWPDETFDIATLSQPIGMKVQSSLRSYTYPRIFLNPKVGPYLLYFEVPGLMFPDEAIKHRGHLLNIDGTPAWDPNGIALNQPVSQSPDIMGLVDTSGNLYFNYHTDSDFELQKVMPDGTLPWGIGGVAYSSAFQGAPDNLSLTSCNDIIICYDGIENIVYSTRISAEGALVYTPSGIPVSTNPAGAHDFDPVSAINKEDKVLLVWTKDENVSDVTMDIYMQGIGKDGILGNTLSTIRQLSPQKLSVYPNPVKNRLQFQADQLSDQSHLLVQDLNGKTLFSHSNIGSDFQLNTSSWPSGVYILRVQTEEEIYVGKIMKE